MEISSRYQKAREIYEEFKTCRIYNYCSITPSMIPNKISGVYAIFEKKTMETLYVGKTTNLRQRLYRNHLMGTLTNARLKKYIIDDNEKFPEINDAESAKQWIKDNCCFQYIIIEDFRERGHAEGLLSFLLETSYVDKEH